MQSPGPEVLHPDGGLIPLSPFARGMGLQLPVFAAPTAWEQVIRNSPYACLIRLAEVIDNALKQVGGTQADYAAIEFKWFMPLDGEGVKTKKVRLVAKLFFSEEVDQAWIRLSLPEL